MKDISKELGISITTISFIINKKAENKISKEVIKIVEDYIEEVGYKPNSSAQTLRTGKSKTIVFMAEDISDPFFASIARQMEEIAFRNGYKIIYCSIENNKERALELLTLFKNREVDAFIITPPENFADEIKRLIYDEHQVVMLFDRYYKEFQHNYVVLENFKGAVDASQVFYEAGKRNIAFVGIESSLSPLVERLDGYRSVIRKRNLTEKILLVKFSDIKSLKGQELFAEFLKKNPEIDSILFATNNLAISGLKVLKKEEVKIPEEISIISFDERDVFQLHNPPISVVSQPVDQLAEELIKGTLNILSTKSRARQYFQKTLKGQLILRPSVDSSLKQNFLSTSPFRNK